MLIILWTALSIGMLVVIFGAIFGALAAVLDSRDYESGRIEERQIERPCEILILGYDRNIGGGIVAVTETLLEAIPNIRLHPIKHCYGARDLWLYAASTIKFAGVALSRRKYLLIHGIVGSRGDRVRMIPALVICALLRIPICVQYHKNVGGLIFKREMLNRLLDLFYRLCTLHVFISNTLRTEFLDMASWVRNSAIIGNALPGAWMHLPLHPLEHRDIDVVFFGRWNAEKGIDVLIEYLSMTPRTLRCEIYTDHAPDIQIRNAVVKPWVEENGVRAILSRAKLLVLPSFFEAYPTVILEALACGTPFVATEVGGIPDIAYEGGGGLLTKPGNSHMLGWMIEYLLDNPDEWQQRSAKGSAWVNKACNAEEIMTQWTEIYRGLKSNGRIELHRRFPSRVADHVGAMSATARGERS